MRRQSQVFGRDFGRSRDRLKPGGGPGIWVIVELRNEMKWHAMLSDQSANFTARDVCDPQV
jgi:hypothetical protein